MVHLLRPPRECLASEVEVLWYADGPLPPRLERIVPAGAMQLIVNLDTDILRWRSGPSLAREHRTSGSGICGVLDYPIGVHTADQLATAGVLFRPGGAAHFFDVPAHALAEPVVGLDGVWGADGATLREQLLSAPDPAAVLARLEAALTAHRTERAGPWPAADHATRLLEAGWPVRDVVAEVGVSASTFTRRFRETVGTTPKTYGRLRRLQRTLRSLPPAPDWARVALQAGYADQSHLIGEFRALTGVTPSAYRWRSPAESNHVVS